MKYILLISILFLSLWGQAQNYFFANNQNKKLITISTPFTVDDGDTYNVTVTANENVEEDTDVTVTVFNGNNLGTSYDATVTINNGTNSAFFQVGLSVVGVSYTVTHTIKSIDSTKDFTIGTPKVDETIVQTI
jgi:hypothetical protein